MGRREMSLRSLLAYFDHPEVAEVQSKLFGGRLPHARRHQPDSVN